MTSNTLRLRPFLALALVGGSLLLSGCVVAAIGGAAYGAIKYSENEVTRDYTADLESTWQATIASLQENGYPIGASAVHGPTGGSISVNEAKVKVMSHPEGFTRVSMRIGTFEKDEHRRRAELILNGIAARLGTP